MIVQSNTINVNIDEAIEKIKKLRIDNILQFDLNYEKAIVLTNQGKFNQALKLTGQDVLGYFHIYQKAYDLEKSGELEKAAKLYWDNIYKNGTDAPGNFNRLLIVLNKLKWHEEELKVCMVFLAFVNKQEVEKIEKRINRIKKKIIK